MFHILVADDDKNTRRYFKALLEEEHYTVSTAADGEEALAVMENELIDLVVLDVMMPNMDGYEFARTLREVRSSVPILMVSAKQLPADRKQGFLSGTDDYMVKPVEEEEMLLRIRAFLRRSQIVSERRITVGNVVLDYDSLTVTKKGETQELPQYDEDRKYNDPHKYGVVQYIRAAPQLSASFGKKWSLKNIELNIDFDEYEVTANEEMMKEVWINLLDNAVKFTPEYGEITVDVEQGSSSTVVRIQNTGDKISDDDIDRIFGKFYQADTSHSSKGTGLGLSIAKKIVELHGGTISVTSDEYKTIFTVELPI